MIKQLLICSLLFCSSAFSQTFTNVSGSVSDTSPQTWSFATVSAQLVGPFGVPGPLTNDGHAITQSLFVTIADIAGNFSFILDSNDHIAPANSYWNITVCPNASAQCSTFKSTITGPVQILTFSPNPFVVNAGPVIQRAYNDIEVSGGNGALYWRTIDNTLRGCQALPNGTCTWVPVGTGGGGTLPPGIPNQQVVYRDIVSPTTTVVGEDHPHYRTDEWMTCDGITDATIGWDNLLNRIGAINKATIDVIGTCAVTSANVPSNVTLDFSTGGAISLIVDHTPPGNGIYIDHSGDGSVQGQSNPAALPTNTCTVSINNLVGNAGHSILVAAAVYGTFAPDNARVVSITDTLGNFYKQKTQTTLGNAAYIALYTAAPLNGGNDIITVHLSHVEKNACIAWDIDGLGPNPVIDSSSFAYGTVTPFSSGVATLLAGDFLANFGEDPNGSQVCTAGAGYTQPSGAAGNVNGAVGVSLCGEYNNAGAGGPTSATQNFSVSPVISSWGDVLVGLRPGIAIINYLGGINNPDKHKIFFNATGADGIVDFTGNLSITEIDPEWWGASTLETAANNTPAIQASAIAAFGCGRTSCRVNGSGLNIYNKQWNLNGQYQINAEIQLYHLIGNQGARWIISCKNNGGLTQTTTNLRVLDMQSTAYGNINNCVFSHNSTSTGALIDIDYDGTHGNDLRPQFLDFNHMTLSGNGNVAIGLLGAKSGGGAQYSNVYCLDCAFNGFTQACYQIGTPTALAQNALSIGYSGDMQFCPKYGMAVYGGGWVSFGGDGNNTSSMENGFATQTGADMFCQASQGPCILRHYRSESRVMAIGNWLDIYDSQVVNQASVPVAGASQPVGTIMRGCSVAGDGAYYKVTIDASPFVGVSSCNAPVNASGGSSTTIVDTNETINGAVTQGTFSVPGELVTQAVTGATGNVVVRPASTATITGSASGAQIIFNELMTQAVTGVTCTEQAPTPVTGSSSPLFCNNFSGTADGVHVWTGGTSGGTYNPNAVPVFSASVMVITAHAGVPDNVNDWVGGTSLGHFKPTTVPTGTNWTVNAFVGQNVAIAFTGSLTSPNQNCYGLITANDANSITVAGGWKTQYSLTRCTAPDNTSLFYTEPNWNHGTVVDGGITMVYMNENVITAGGNSHIEDVYAPGGKIGGLSTRLHATIKNLLVSRPDWFDTTLGFPQTPAPMDQNWDVRAFLPGGANPINWQLPTSPAGLSVNSSLQYLLGTKLLVWSTGGTSPTTSASSTWIGGRSDPNPTNITSRNILEFGGMLGRAAPVPSAANNYDPVDQNGTDTDITGGPSSGGGVGGAINFYTSNRPFPAVPGVGINSGNKRFIVESSGLVSTTDGLHGSKQTGGPVECEPTFGITTLSVGGTTTDTSNNCLPADSMIDAVVYRITTTIAGIANFTIGDAVTPARFCTAQTTLVAGTTGKCFVQADQTGALGPRQTTASLLRVTTNVIPTAGAIRLIVYYHTWIPPIN